MHYALRALFLTFFTSYYICYILYQSQYTQLSKFRRKMMQEKNYDL